MGTKSTKEAEQANSKAETISDLFALSKVDPQDGIDAVTLDGIIGHLRKASMQPDDWAAMDILHRVHWYQMVQDLVRKVGMSARRQSEILREFYPLLNRNGDMRGAGISPPNGDDSSDSDSGSTNGSGSISGSDDSAHPALLLQQLDESLAKPHSYLVLAGWTKQQLVRYSTEQLREVLAADTSFVDKSTDYTPLAVTLTNFTPSTSTASSAPASSPTTTINYWNLPEDRRESAVRDLIQNYTAEFADTIGAAPATNKVPIAAFMAGKDAAIAAIREGYDFFESSERARALFGRTAVSINLVLLGANTLAGRGASSITETSMPESPDGHSNRGLKLWKS